MTPQTDFDDDRSTEIIDTESPTAPRPADRRRPHDEATIRDLGAAEPPSAPTPARAPSVRSPARAPSVRTEHERRAYPGEAPVRPATGPSARAEYERLVERSPNLKDPASTPIDPATPPRRALEPLPRKTPRPELASAHPQPTPRPALHATPRPALERLDQNTSMPPPDHRRTPSSSRPRALPPSRAHVVRSLVPPSMPMPTPPPRLRRDDVLTLELKIALVTLLIASILCVIIALPHLRDLFGSFGHAVPSIDAIPDEPKTVDITATSTGPQIHQRSPRQH